MESGLERGRSFYAAGGAGGDVMRRMGVLISAWAASDPVERFRAWLVEHAAFTDEEDAALAAEVKAVLADALRRAEDSQLPDPATVADGVYA